MFRLLEKFKPSARWLLPMVSYFLLELFALCLLGTGNWSGPVFGLLWAILLSSIVILLPKLAGRIFYGISYYCMLLWTLAQTGYFNVFGRMMWLSGIFFAGDGAPYLTEVLVSFPVFWWIGGLLLLALGVVVIWRMPGGKREYWQQIACAGFAAFSLIMLFILPQIVFLRDKFVWGTRSEYAQSSSWKATYNTMYDAKNVYDICGIYQLTFRDVWKNHIYPLTPAYRNELEVQTTEVREYFTQRGVHEDNEMTGIFAGKNVVLVLMESMDDWMLTQADTPTICRLMEEGIQFTNFYTPGFGTARTINSEFCINTGIYLPTTGDYVFDYVTNEFDQSVASRATASGYTAEMFHYNSPDFYSRGVFEPAMGYNKYNCYADYEQDEDRLYDDCLLFDIPELNELFFREGQTLNTIITRSAHLSYVYNEVLSNYALKQYPQYRGKFDSQEEDCARVKAKLVDDMFARLLEELEKNDQLENTVIIGVTDHYTYGYKNVDELYKHSGVNDELLLEKTPCFIWSYDGPVMRVDKTLNTADFLPTVVNLMGFEMPAEYLGQDAFDPNYTGYVLFPDGSWITDGVVCKVVKGKNEILENKNQKEITEEFLQQMGQTSQNFIRISNLLLTSDYYRSID